VSLPRITAISYGLRVSPIAIADSGLSPEMLSAFVNAIGNSPIAAALFAGLWLISRVIKTTLETRADAGIRAIVSLSMAIKNASTLPAPAPSRPRTRPRTGPQATLPQ